MAIRLLDKKTVNTEVASQRKHQIDEGIALATKIDVLRKTLSSEEARLTEFRAHTIAAVQKEIDAKVAEKEMLEEVLQALKEKRAKLLMPLDAEWVKVTQEKESIGVVKQGLYERGERLTEREQKVSTMEKEAQEEKDRAESLKKQASESLAEAEAMLLHAKEAAAKMRNDAQVVLAAAELKEIEASSKEKAVSVREEEIDRNWQRIREKETDLATKEIQLRDREQILARTIKRLGL